MFKKTLFLLVSLLLFAMSGTLQAKPTLQDDRYFPETDFSVENDVIWDYFQSRGGVDTFGYPVSDLLTFRGFDVQIFQRHVLQINGQQARPLNLLDPDVMPINSFGGLTFPAYDEGVAEQAPAPDSANYGEAVRQHLEANVPETWQGQPIAFLPYYLSAAPQDAGNLDTLLALEVWGFPTSSPKRDPNNENFIYQRFQRGIMHYDATTQITAGILLGDAFKNTTVQEEGSETIAPIPALNDLELIASATQLTFESWSPDSQFLSYRAHSAIDLQQNPQLPPGAFVLLGTENKEIRCIVDYNQRRPHFWIDTAGNNMQLLFVTDSNEVVIWAGCSDERTSLTDLFPEAPQALLATDENGSQFIFAGETSYWLNRADMLEPRQISGVEVTPWSSASWSPDARYVALSQIRNADEGTTYLIDVEGAEVLQTISWQSIGGKGAPAAPDWLSQSEFLIYLTRDRGPLLVTVDGEITEVAPELFGVEHQTGEFVRTAYGTRDDVNGSYHIALTAQGQEASFPSIQLYHSESGEIEELSFNNVGSPIFSPDGQWLTLLKNVEIQDATGIRYEAYETWLRPVEPTGSEATLLLGRDYKYPTWSPDFSQVAATSNNRLVVLSVPDGTIRQEWRINRPTIARAWSPNGKWLVVHQPVTPDGKQERLFVVPVE